jgi:hypothetical protein
MISEPRHSFPDQPHYTSTHLVDPDGNDVELIQESIK